MIREHNFILALTVTLLAGTSGHALAAGGAGVLADPGAMEGKHFHPKGKMPSKFTVELQDGLRKTLPFEDRRDADEAVAKPRSTASSRRVRRSSRATASPSIS